MHIAVFEVLRPVHGRAEKRLGRRYVLAFENTRLVVQRSGPIRSPSVHVERFATPDDLIAVVKERIHRRLCQLLTLSGVIFRLLEG